MMAPRPFRGAYWHIEIADPVAALADQRLTPLYARPSFSPSLAKERPRPPIVTSALAVEPNWPLFRAREPAPKTDAQKDFSEPRRSDQTSKDDCRLSDPSARPSQLSHVGPLATASPFFQMRETPAAKIAVKMALTRTNVPRRKSLDLA